MKFKAPIEVQAGISDGDPTNPLGLAGYLLSSDGSNVSWVSPGGLSAETAESIVQPIKANEALTKGDPLYIVGYQNGQDVNIVEKADSSDPAKMPVVGIADADYSSQAFGTMTAFGSFNGNFDTTGGAENWSIGDIIFVKPGGGLTNIKPVGTDLIQNIAIVSRVQQNTGELEVIALGRTNDVPNLPTGRLFVGTATNTSLTSDVVYIDDTNNKVGIGTTSPSTKLEISSSGVNGIDISQSASNATQSGRLFFSTNTASEGFALFNSNGTLQINSGGIPNNTSGTNRISILGNGNVGIGTTSPDYKLEVDGTLGVSRTDGIIFAGAAGTGTGNKITSDTSNDFIFSTALVSSPYTSSERMRIDNGGNVGIGTTGPSSILHIEDTTPILKIVSTGNFNNSFIEMGNGALADAGKISCFNNPGLSALELKFDNGSPGDARIRVGQRYLDFGIDGSTAMYVNSSKNVGIGTTSPDSKLHVYANNADAPTVVTIENGDTAVVAGQDLAKIQFLTSDTSAPGAGVAASIRAVCQNAGNIFDLAFNTQNGPTRTERMRLTGAGNLGLGTTSLTSISSTSRTLSLGSTSTTTSGGIAFQVNGVVKAYNYVTSDYLINQTVSGIGQIFYGAGSERMRIHKTTGNVGIGTTSPSSKLQVNGGVQLSNDTAAASATKVGTFRYYTSGNNSYVDMCMQTGASTYAWVNIVTNSW